VGSVTESPTEDDMSDRAEFDAFAKNYDEALSEGLSLTGEGPLVYAERRIAVTQKLISKHGFKADRILDFGCGTGTSIPLLNVAFSPVELVGIDISIESLAEARLNVGLQNVRFESAEQACFATRLILPIATACSITLNRQNERTPAEWCSMLCGLEAFSRFGRTIP
jgi:predicted TPR repeat methyltransferase